MGRSFAIGLFLRLLRMDPLLSILSRLCIVDTFFEEVGFGFGSGRPLEVLDLGRRNERNEKAPETFGTMDEGAEDSLVNRASCGVNERDRGTRATLGLTFSMPPNRQPTCIQLGDGGSILGDRGEAPAVSPRVAHGRGLFKRKR